MNGKVVCADLLGNDEAVNGEAVCADFLGGDEMTHEVIALQINSSSLLSWNVPW